MPHKRAKRSVREQQQKERGNDLAPKTSSLSNEAIPKSISRVLNATKIREDWKSSKRKLEEGDNDSSPRKKTKRDGANKGAEGRKAKGKEKEKTKTELKILPGESIQHFNKRVEDSMRSFVKTAVQASKLVTRKARKAALEAKAAQKSKNAQGAMGQGSPSDAAESGDEPSSSRRPDDSQQKPVKSFASQSSSAPKRLNDIAQAPPEFKNLPRGARSAGKLPGKSKADNVVSMAQKAMLEEERERVIQKYRELKASKLAAYAAAAPA